MFFFFKVFYREILKNYYFQYFQVRSRSGFDFMVGYVSGFLACYSRGSDPGNITSYSADLNPDPVSINSDPALPSGFGSGKSEPGSATLILLAVHHHVHNKSYFQHTIFHQQKYQNSEGDSETRDFFPH